MAELERRKRRNAMVEVVQVINANMYENDREESSIRQSLKKTKNTRI